MTKDQDYEISKEIQLIHYKVLNEYRTGDQISGNTFFHRYHHQVYSNPKIPEQTRKKLILECHATVYEIFGDKSGFP